MTTLKAPHAPSITKVLRAAGHRYSETRSAGRGVVRGGWQTWTSGFKTVAAGRGEPHVRVFHRFNSDSRPLPDARKRQTLDALNDYAASLRAAGYVVEINEMRAATDFGEPHVKVIGKTAP